MWTIIRSELIQGIHGFNFLDRQLLEHKGDNDESAGTVSEAFQVAESRMWKAALKFCEIESKSHEIRNYRKETALYSKGKVWVLGGFRCLSINGMK